MSNIRICKRIDIYKEDPMQLAKLFYSSASFYDKEKDLSAWFDCAKDVLKDFLMTARMLSKVIKCYDCPVVNKCTCEDWDDEKEWQSKCECCFKEWLIEPVIVFANEDKSIKVCTNGFDYNQIYSYQNQDDTLKDPEEYPTIEQLIFSWALLNELLDASDLFEPYEDNENWKLLDKAIEKACKIYQLKYGESNE